MMRTHRISFLTVCLVFAMSTVALAQKVALSEKTAAAAMRKEIARLVNLKRSIYNMPPLHLNDTLSAIADEHSLRMERKIVPMGHDGFAQRDSTIHALWKDAGGSGENVTAAESAEEAVELWWSSEGHKDNMLADWNETGIGVKRVEGSDFWYCTQIFVKR
jgi:uncharacterized protein YkwD